MADIPIVFLNLKRSRDRRADMEAQLKGRGLNYHFLESVDGYTLSPEEASLYDEPLAIQWSGRPLRLTEIGCALSHKRAYEWMVQKRIERLLVCEDDTWFKPEFYTAWQTMDNWLPDRWGIINFSVSAFDPFSLSAYQAHRRGPKLYSIPALADYYVLRCVNHTVLATCYLITLAAAKRLLALTPKIYLPADELIGLVHLTKIATYTTLPPLIQLREFSASASTINEERANTQIAKRIQQNKHLYSSPARALMHHRPMTYRIQRIFIYLKLAFHYTATRKEIPHRLLLFMGDACAYFLSKLRRVF